MSLQIANVPEFRKALRLAVQAGKRDEAAILNRWTPFVLIEAYKRTKKADPQRIKADLTGPDRLAIRIVVSRARKAGRRLSRQQARTSRGTFDRKGTSIAKEAKKLIARRMASAKYVAVGFLKANQGFGKSKNIKVNPRSEAAKSYGIPARPGLLKAYVGNNSIYADVIAGSPLETAMRVIAAKEIAYAQRRLSRTFKAYSGRKR